MARALGAIVSAAVAAAICLALAAPANALVPAIDQPAWRDLTGQQRQVLAPLAAEWDSLEPFRRKKWIGIAQRYPRMTSAEQERVQRRMQQWVNLTPEERKAAREKFMTLRNAPPEQRATVKEKWLQYKSLPEDEKRRLKEAAKRRGVTKPVAGRTAPPRSPLKPSSPQGASATALSQPLTTQVTQPTAAQQTQGTTAPRSGTTGAAASAPAP